MEENADLKQECFLCLELFLAVDLSDWEILVEYLINLPWRIAEEFLSANKSSLQNAKRRNIYTVIEDRYQSRHELNRFNKARALLHSGNRRLLIFRMDSQHGRREMRKSCLATLSVCSKCGQSFYCLHRGWQPLVNKKTAFRSRCLYILAGVSSTPMLWPYVRLCGTFNRLVHLGRKILCKKCNSRKALLFTRIWCINICKTFTYLKFLFHCSSTVFNPRMNTYTCVYIHLYRNTVHKCRIFYLDFVQLNTA